jgi:WD40 repeat protein
MSILALDEEEPVPRLSDAPQGSLACAGLHLPDVCSSTTETVKVGTLSSRQLQGLLARRGTPEALLAIFRERNFDGRHFLTEMFLLDAYPMDIRNDSLRVPLARLSRIHRELRATGTVARNEVPFDDLPAQGDLKTAPKPALEQQLHEEKVRFEAHDQGRGEFLVAYDANFRFITVSSIAVTHLAGHAGEVTCVCESGNGATIVTGGSDETARVWEGHSGKEVHRLTGHTGALTSVAMCGSKLVTASWDKTARLWDTAVSFRQPAKVLQGHTNAVASLCFSPDARLLATGGADDIIKVWDVSEQLPVELAVLRGHRGTILGLVFSSDSARILSCGEDFTARQWDVETRLCTAVFEGHTFAVTSCCFAAGESLIVTGSCDETAKIWNTASRRLLHTLRGHRGSVTSVCVAAAVGDEGEKVATGCEDSTVRLWSVESGLLLASIKGHRSAVTSLAFSAGGCRLLSGCSDSLCRIWFLETIRTVARFSADAGDTLLSARALFFNTDNSLMVSVSSTPENGDSPQVLLWHCADASLINVLGGAPQSVSVVAFSNKASSSLEEEAFVAAGGDDGTVTAWEASTGRCLLFAPKAHKGQRIASLGFAVHISDPAGSAQTTPQVLLRSRDVRHVDRFWTKADAEVFPTYADSEGQYYFTSNN